MSARKRPDSVRYRVRCYGSHIWKDGQMTGVQEGCGWYGYRHDNPYDCECYSDWARYCRAESPGPGCPRGVTWRCPRCSQSVVVVYKRRPAKKAVSA